MNDLNFNNETGDLSLSHCTNCDKLINTNSRFCGNCGFEQLNHDDELGSEKWNAIKQIAAFFLIDAVICCVIPFVSFFKTLEWSIFFDAFLAIISISFFCYNWSKYKSLLVWHNFSLLKLIGYCSIAVVSSMIIGVFVRSLNQTLFSKRFSYYAFYAPHQHGKALAIFFIAIMPALFEELGYRGFLLGKLFQVVDKKQAIFISSFLFAIMHISFISLFWIIPFALLLAVIRVKENTLWYGIFIHFSFNFTVCVTEILSSNHYR